MIPQRKVGTRQKLFSLWMVIAFLWASLFALQLQTPYQVGPDRLWGEPTPTKTLEQECANLSDANRKACEMSYKTVAATLIFGTARFTSTERLYLMVGPPLWILALGIVVTLIIGKRRLPPLSGTPPAATP
jgi:hypothetical protein